MKKETTYLEDISGLKIPGLRTREALNEIEYKHYADTCYDYEIGKKKLKGFSRESLNKLHRNIFYKLWKWAGKKRTSDTNLGVRHFQIDEQFQHFFEDLKAWELKKMDPVEIAVRIHHRLVHIHPYLNGNGRWARLATNIYLIQKTRRLFLWPEEELREEGSLRKSYFTALQEADQLNYAPLIEWHRRMITPLP